MSEIVWAKLTNEQQSAVNAVRQRMMKHLVTETHEFQQDNPEVWLTWSLYVDPIIGPVQGLPAVRAFGNFIGFEYQYPE